MPLDDGVHAYLYGAATGVWNVDWITFWGMVLFNTLGVSGIFENFRRWLIAQGSMDVRVQTMLFAWAFGALLEGLVGFGYPWAVVAPILISLGISDLNAIRVAAIANNAPVSFGALGAPVIALAAVTGYPLLALSGSVGTVVAVLALLPPWVLLYLVVRQRGHEGRLAARHRRLARLYRRAVPGRGVSRALPAGCHRLDRVLRALLILLKVWQPQTVLGYGGVPVDAAARAAAQRGHGLTAGEVLQAWMPFAVLLIVVAAWTGPWSPLPKVSWFKTQAIACSALAASCPAKGNVTAVFNFAPYVGGSAILASWLIVPLLLLAMGSSRARRSARCSGAPSTRCGERCLVGVFIFGLAYVFNYSGMAASLAKGFCRARHARSSSWRRCSASSAWRSPARTPPPTRCSASSRRWSARSSACRRCCCRR